MFGILNVNKPAGWTSRDVVNRVEKLVRPAKAGHAGTLDPLATGVLIVCVGPATRLVQYVQQMPKEYRATFLLGRTSPTEDIEGEVSELPDPPQPSREDVESVLPRFLGEIEQRPPAHSALRIDGKRAYQLARQGQPVLLEPRAVHVYQLTVEQYQYPQLKLRIRCGSGTYVRSLGRDLAEALGTGAVMSALTRSAIGRYRLEDAVATEQLDLQQIGDHLLSPRTAVEHLPQLPLGEAELAEIQHGRLISVPEGLPSQTDLQPNEEAPLIAGLDARGQLVALLRERQEGLLGPVCNFPRAD